MISYVLAFSSFLMSELIFSNFIPPDEAESSLKTAA